MENSFIYTGSNYKSITIADIATQTGRAATAFHLRRRPPTLEVTVTFDDATAQEETDLDTLMSDNGLVKQ